MTRSFALAALLVLSLCAPAGAQQWPSKPVRIIVAQSAGTPTDALGRMLADAMGRNLGGSVVVDNRAGADGLIGTEAIAKSPPDGYTIGLGTQATLAIEPLLRKSMPYDTNADFSPIAVIVDDTGGLAWFANASMPYATLPQMIAFAKANPGKVTYATNASSHVMMGEWMKKKAGVDLVQVPYKAGPQAYSDVVSGVVSTAISAPATLAPFVKSGQLRVVAVGSRTRIKDWPDVQSISEVFPDFSMNSWVVLIGPASLPQPIVARLNQAAAAALKDPSFDEQVRKLRWVNHGGARTPRDTQAFVEAGRKEWASVINTIGLTAR